MKFSEPGIISRNDEFLRIYDHEQKNSQINAKKYVITNKT